MRVACGRAAHEEATRIALGLAAEQERHVAAVVLQCKWRGYFERTRVFKHVAHRDTLVSAPP